MRILITTSVRFGLNGITNVILNYYRNIISDKIHFDFVVINELDDKTKQEIINRGGTIYYLPMRNKNPIHYVRQLIKICDNGKYDIIHSHGNSYTLALEMYAAKRANIKIRIAHSHAINCRNNIINCLLKPLFIRTYTHGFACSEPAGNWLFKQKEYIVLNNAFNIEKFKFNQEFRNKYRKKLNIDHYTVIGHVGGFTDDKNHLFLIDVFNEYQIMNPNSILILVGDGKRKSKILNYINNLGLTNKILLLGRRKDVELILNAFDIFVFPSKNEGLGIALLEAQVNGLPVIASDNIPKKAKVLDNFRFMSLNDSPKKWALLINNMDKQRDLNGYKKVMNSGYDIRKEAKKLERLYHKLFFEENSYLD